MSFNDPFMLYNNALCISIHYELVWVIFKYGYIQGGLYTGVWLRFFNPAKVTGLYLGGGYSPGNTVLKKILTFAIMFTLSNVFKGAS